MMSLFGKVGPVFRKEMTDAIRDRRSVMSALIFPLFAPLMINVMFGTIAARERDAENLEISIQGAEHAPGLIQWIERAGHEMVPAEGDLFEAVREGDLDLAILIDSTYAEDFAAGRQASVGLIVDGSKATNAALNRRARGIINGYNANMSSLRLMARGVSPTVRNPVVIDEMDVATAQERSAVFLNFIPLFIVMAAFISGMNVAIDTTAGERERGSLEPLLINPAPRTSIILGKWLVTTVFASIGIVLVLFATLLALQTMSLEDLGVRLDLGPVQVLGVLAGTVPLAFLASAFQLLVSTFARSFKEAQMYINLLIFIPLIPGFVATVASIPTDTWTALVPALAQQVLLTEVLGGSNPGMTSFILAGASSLVLALICVVVTAKLFQNERIILGQK